MESLYLLMSLTSFGRFIKIKNIIDYQVKKGISNNYNHED